MKKTQVKPREREKQDEDVLSVLEETDEAGQEHVRQCADVENALRTGNKMKVKKKKDGEKKNKSEEEGESH